MRNALLFCDLVATRRLLADGDAEAAHGACPRRGARARRLWGPFVARPADRAASLARPPRVPSLVGARGEDDQSDLYRVWRSGDLGWWRREKLALQQSRGLPKLIVLQLDRFVEGGREKERSPAVAATRMVVNDSQRDSRN